ncbi:MAG: ankyrin repeat domain-containing protein [Hyphomonadaceae bacterium]
MKAGLGWFIAIAGAAAVALSAAAQGPTQLAVGPDAGGYLCSDGRQLYVKSCYDESLYAYCGVVQMHLPLNRGQWQVETTETRSDLISKIAGCKVYPLQFRDGIVSLVVPKQLAPTSPPAKSTQSQNAKPTTPGSKPITTTAAPANLEIVRISQSGVKPTVHYLHLGSITPSKNVANAVEVWSLKVFPNGDEAYPGARGVWSALAVDCKQLTLTVLMEMPIDEKGAETKQGARLLNTRATYAKNSPGERIVKTACGGEAPRGPRLPTEMAAFADAATALSTPGPSLALVRISPPGKAPIVMYVDTSSAKETGQKGLNTIWSLQVYTSPNAAYPKASALWVHYEIECNQSNLRLTDTVELDPKGKALAAHNIDDFVRPVAKGSLGEFIAIAACKTGQLSGARFQSLAAAVADAATAQAPPVVTKPAPAPVKAPIRLPQTDVEKAVFEFIKTNQVQAAVNAIIRAPGGKLESLPKLTDKQGMTALHWAATNSNAAATRWLLDKGPDVDVADEKGRTPLKIALDNKDPRIMTLLMDGGADERFALPGHDAELKAFKTTRERADFMIELAALAKK